MEQAYTLLLQESRDRRKQTNAFLISLKKSAGKELLPILREAHTKAFSEVSCLACANCCKTSPPLVTVEDISRISRHLGLTQKEFSARYVLKDVNGELSFATVPCRFLADDNYCTIYEVRPQSCRRYPHTDEEAYPIRTSLNLTNTLICPAAYKVVRNLEKSLHL